MLEVELYKENILEHYKNPQNKGVLEGGKVGRGVNPSCGDVLSIYLREEHGVIKDISFDGEGCAISTAGASMLTEHVKGMPFRDAKKISEDDVFKMLHVEISPSREKCALLSLRALREIVC